MWQFIWQGWQSCVRYYCWTSKQLLLDDLIEQEYPKQRLGFCRVCRKKMKFEDVPKHLDCYEKVYQNYRLELERAYQEYYMDEESQNQLKI